MLFALLCYVLTFGCPVLLDMTVQRAMRHRSCVPCRCSSTDMLYSNRAPNDGFKLLVRVLASSLLRTLALTRVNVTHAILYHLILTWFES